VFYKQKILQIVLLHWK